MAMQDSTNPLQGVAGPGQYSKRTDLEYQSPEYGAGVQYAQDKAGAPLASTPGVKGEAPSTFRRNVERSMGNAANQEITSLYAPTQRPAEPVTHGIDLGAGGGSNVLNMPNVEQTQYATAYEMINQWASNPDASPTLQYLAQRIKQGY